MNIAIISGSNRNNSGSRKTADYIENYCKNNDIDVDLFDLHTESVPMWTEDMWNTESDQAKNWQQYKQRLDNCDALVIIAVEWNGTIPPSLQNFIMHLDRETVGHKPVLLVGVSAGVGGTYPIAELKSFTNKNNRMLFIPDHVIVRNVQDNFDTSEHQIGPRIQQSVDQLILYAKHMCHVRTEMAFDYQQFNNGM